MKEHTEKERGALLAKIEERRKLLETSLQAVVQGYSPAMFVWGSPGLGKSHVLTTMLDGMVSGTWKHHTAYSTPKALVMSLAETPASIHLFEDCERLLKTDLSASVLRAACGAPGDRDRWVTWETANERFRIRFTGGIVIATNANLARASGPMQGVASRFRPVHWTMTVEERIAVIFDIAHRGWAKGKIQLTAKDCLKVARSLLEECKNAETEIGLDIRLFTEHALPIFAYCKAEGLDNWEDVLVSRLHGIASGRHERQEEKSHRLRDLALMIDQGPGKGRDKVASWKAKTGLGQAIYYRHLREAKKGLDTKKSKADTPA